ncbi:MAG: hypothetical protein ABID09_05650 [Candidatus Omnitrophota bacterium]
MEENKEINEESSGSVEQGKGADAPKEEKNQVPEKKDELIAEEAAPATEEVKEEKAAEVKETPKTEGAEVAPEKPKKPDMKPVSKADRPRECGVCNKSIKKQWFYRDGKFFCGKRCWKKSKAEASGKKAEEK